MVDKQIKSYFERVQLSEALTISNLGYDVSRSAKNLSSDFKLCSIDSHDFKAPLFLFYFTYEAVVRCERIKLVLIFILIIIFVYFDFWNH